MNDRGKNGVDLSDLESGLRALIQRVRRACVSVGGEVRGEIGPGLLVLLGAGEADGERELDYVVDKTVNLRIFADEAGKMNLSVKDVGGSVLVVSQFTLYADVRKGRRPSFVGAMGAREAEVLVERFVARCGEHVGRVETGVFGADMQVDLVNDGPVTIWIDSEERGR